MKVVVKIIAWSIVASVLTKRFIRAKIIDWQLKKAYKLYLKTNRLDRDWPSTPSFERWERELALDKKEEAQEESYGGTSTNPLYSPLLGGMAGAALGGLAGIRGLAGTAQAMAQENALARAQAQQNLAMQQAAAQYNAYAQSAAAQAQLSGLGQQSDPSKSYLLGLENLFYK